MIQAFCSQKDLLSLTSVNKTAFATRFYNPPLQKLSFKTVKDIAQFLSYCQASQERQAQALVLEEGQKSRERLKPALSSDPTMRFTLLTREHLQAVKALTLNLCGQFTAEQYELLFTYLPGIQHLTLYVTKENHCALGPLLKAMQCLTLHYLAIFNTNDPNHFNYNKIDDHLLDELWQLTALETLTISGFKHIYSISEKIGQLTALKSLTLEDMGSLEALPASLGRLDKLEALTLTRLNNITALPEEMGLPRALRTLMLSCMDRLKALPASLGRLDKLETLRLVKLFFITTLPKSIGQLNALKSLTLEDMHSLKALPASLGQLNKLEALTLKDLFSITALPKEIGQLRALKVVELINMEHIKMLPRNFPWHKLPEASRLIKDPV
jgi:Leucine-rich repeat (LRR) protein